MDVKHILINSTRKGKLYVIPKCISITSKWNLDIMLLVLQRIRLILINFLESSLTGKNIYFNVNFTGISIFKFEKNMLNQVIKDIHFYIFPIKQRLISIKNNITRIFPDFKSNENIKYQKFLNNKKQHIEKQRLIKKLDKLKNNSDDNIKRNLHITSNNNNDYGDLWLLNLSDTCIHKNDLDILRLGPDFNLQFTTNKNDHIFEIVKDLETNFIRFPEKSHDELRHRILSILSKYLKKSIHNSHLEKTIEKDVKLTREFLKKNRLIVY